MSVLFPILAVALMLLFTRALYVITMRHKHNWTITIAAVLLYTIFGAVLIIAIAYYVTL